MLARLGAQTTGFALAPPTTPALFDVAGVGETLSDLRGDIVDHAALSAAITAADPEIIIHMAAQALVKEGYADPVGTYLTNVMGTVNVLDAARCAPNLQAVIIVTSDKCYENRDSIWGYRETDPLGGRDPYSNSKACAELVASAYRQSFFAEREHPVQIMSARAGNVVGGGDFSADRIIPDAVRAFMAGRPVSVRNPHAIRPWQHVLDPLCGYLLLAELACRRNMEVSGMEVSEGWNFGPDRGSEENVETLITRFSKSWGAAASWTPDRAQHAYEAKVLRLDTSKARERLDWRPVLLFEDMIEWTAAWYREFADGSDMRAVTMEQVDCFLGLSGRQAPINRSKIVEERADVYASI
jgi:CDP-glucose 4,6-dehydratase